MDLSYQRPWLEKSFCTSFIIFYETPLPASYFVFNLCRMPNSMGIEDFTELQGRALHAVLTAYPTGTIPALSETLISDSRGIGDKVIVLAVLARGALTLAGIEQDNFDLKRIGNDAPIVESGGTSVAVGKTVIKRPIKLRVMKERTRYFNNPLANLIPAFIFPVEQLLGNTIYM